MADATTTNRGYIYPNGKDLIPNGPAEIQALAVDLDTENRGEIDYLQAGVTLSTDWSFTAALESSSEGKLDSTANTGGVCWCPLAAIGLVRSVTTAAKIKALKPASLPGSGKYMAVGFELTPTTSDGAATVSVVSGAEQTTQKLAEENVPATTAGKDRIRNIVLLNTSGTYSIAAQFDVRPWCTGGVTTETKEEAKIGAGTVSLGKLATALAPCVFRTGDLRLTALSAVETGWLACEGQAVSRATYAALFAAIGTLYGEGDKSTTFNVPNYIERVPMGAGSTNKLGASLGEATHTLTEAEMPKHSHEYEEASYGSQHFEEKPGGLFQILLNLAKGSTTQKGSGGAHNNIQPSTVCNVWIKT